VQLILILFIVLPLLGFGSSLLFKNHQEKAIANCAIISSGLQMVASISIFGYWVSQGSPLINIEIFTLYRSANFTFNVDFFYDKLTAVFMLVLSILVFIVAIFSKSYMHRESGYKRYFNHFMIFYVGISILVLAGNFETFFVGWEIVGITSFLLIAFYRDRYLPVRNSLKVLTYFRLGDVALVCAFWFCHHIFEGSIMFYELHNGIDINDVIALHPVQSVAAAIFFVIAAAIKSAQFPSSSWLPRAMEGPTVSSAIFYGSLSVHAGLFLLIRTAPIWDSMLIIKLIIGIIGIVTVIVSTLITRVQPTAKTQIAYGSVTQIGLMFLEVACGFYTLALVHFAANAFLRTYQLLVSPSSMSYLIHQQFFNYNASRQAMFSFLPAKLNKTLYMLAIKEFNMDYYPYRYLWLPLKKIGRFFHFLRHGAGEILFLGLLIFGLFAYIIYPLDGIYQYSYVSFIYSIIALIITLIAWTERRSATRSWVYIAMSQMFFMLSIVQQNHFTLLQILLYVSGILGAFVVGFYSLNRVKTIENNNSLNEFHGHIYEHPKLGLLFLLSALTIIGFPMSPTFLGFDIMFSEIGHDHWYLLAINAVTFIVLEYAALRIYARVFLGQHVKSYHEVAFRSS
jgi:NADH-quinone oxidoreductase subunit L